MNMNDAIYAYRNAQRGVASGGGMASRETESTGPSFGSMVKEAVQSAIATQKQSDQVSKRCGQRQADMTVVVLAVNNRGDHAAKRRRGARQGRRGLSGNHAHADLTSASFSICPFS